MSRSVSVFVQHPDVYKFQGVFSLLVFRKKTKRERRNSSSQSTTSSQPELLSEPEPEPEPEPKPKQEEKPKQVHLHVPEKRSYDDEELNRLRESNAFTHPSETFRPRSMHGLDSKFITHF